MSDQSENMHNISSLDYKPKVLNGGDNHSDATGSSVWLVSFTDVIALMLTFFVLLYSMSSPDTQKWEYKVGVQLDPVAEYAGPAQNAGINEGMNINRIDYSAGENTDYIEALLKETLNEAGAGNRFVIDKVGPNVKIMFSNRMFDGAQTLNQTAFAALDRLAPVLDNLNNQIMVSTTPGDGDPSKQLIKMQAIGQALVNGGYEKPISLNISYAYAQSQSDMFEVLIMPHDGRRIIR